jgi:GT2 family glycosyltransferase
VARAAGEIVLFCDADDEVQGDWIRRYVEAAGLSDSDIFAGTLRRSYRGRVRSMTGLFTSLWSLPSGSGANFAIRRSSFPEGDLFDESFRNGGDDTAFFWQSQIAGHALEHVPTAVVNYTERDKMLGFLRQQFSYGGAQTRLYAEFADHGMPRSGIPRMLRDVLVALVRTFSIGAWDRRQALGTLALRFGRLCSSVRSGVRYF